MEKQGLFRALQFLLDHQLTVATLITDRHKQIPKFISTKHPDIVHHYNVWHVSKGALVTVQLHDGNSHAQNRGLKKKMLKLSKYRDCDLTLRSPKANIVAFLRKPLIIIP